MEKDLSTSENQAVAPDDDPLLSSQTKCFGLVLVAGASDLGNRPHFLELRTRRGSGGMKVLIKGGQVVNDDAMFYADVLLEDGIIKQVGPNLTSPPGARTIDAHGKMVIPGGIDPHTHLQLPFMGTTAVDDFTTGTQAAVAGGTTMLIDVVVPSPGESLLSAFERWRGWADGKVTCDYALTVAVPQFTEKVKEEMTQLTKERGVNSFQFYMAYKDRLMLRDDELYSALTHCRQIGALARVHAENGDVIAEKEREMLGLGITGPEGHVQSRPEELEAEAANRACVLGRQANCPMYILTVTSKSAADSIVEHRKRGTQVWGESIVASLGTDGTHYFNKCWRHAAGHVTSPPLRLDTNTPAYLMDMLSSSQLHVSSSNNCTFNSEQKAIGSSNFTAIPHGVNGLEDRMTVVWEKGVEVGKMDPMRFVAVTSTSAAKLYNLYPKKGRIAVGADADVVVWDPNGKRTISAKTHHQAVDFNIFEGLTCHGLAEVTIAGGKIVWENGQLSTASGHGKLLPLPPHSPYVFALINQREKVCLPQKVDRAAYDGKAVKPIAEPPIVPKSAANVHHAPPPAVNNRVTKSGVRNQFETSFNPYGDEEEKKNPTTRVNQPPGGASRPLW